MYRGATVAVVVPAYNEADHVGEVVATVPGFVDRVYAVDDCSTDGTWSVIREHADVCLESPRDDPSRAASSSRSYSGWGDPDSAPDPVPEADGGDHPEAGPLVVGVRHPDNRGVGGAIKTGYRLALADGMDVTAVMGGDGQMDPDHLDDIVAPVVEGRADYAKGTRLSQSDHVAAMSRWRRFGNWLLTHLTRLSTGCWDVEDPQNGYTAVSLRALERIRIDDLYDRYGFANDLLAALSRQGMRVVDVPHPARYGDEGSEIRYRTFVPGLSGLLVVNFLRRIRRTAAVRPLDPAVLGYLLAVVGLSAAGLAAVVVLANPPGVARALPVWTVPAALAAGVVCALAGLVADTRQGRRTPPASRQSTDVGDGGGGA